MRTKKESSQGRSALPEKIGQKGLLRFAAAIVTATVCLSGGIQQITAAVVGAALLILLILLMRKGQGLTIYVNPASAAVGVYICFYCVSWIWAVDHGMAAYGILRALPVLLWTVVLMQTDGDLETLIYRLIPWTGAAMTVLSFLFQLIPPLSEVFAPKGRLAGFFEYPNTYALYLLVGIVLLGTKEERPKWRAGLYAVLTFGIFASGSRTSFLLLILVAAVLCILRRKGRFTLEMLLALAAGLAVSRGFEMLGLLGAASRYSTTATEADTLLCRLLYWKDALPVILRHPFGLGYLGYYTLQSSFQHGVYSVRYVHNELLQILLDVGWIPAIVLIGAFAEGFFQKDADAGSRLILFAVLAHCMMDFDLQFLAVWFILLLSLNLRRGKAVTLRKGGVRSVAVCACCAVFCLWAGIGDLCYSMNLPFLSAQLTPFHTYAQTATLKRIESPEELDGRADTVLALSPYVPLAHSAKGNAAFSQGDIRTMIAEKEKTLELAPYYLENYCDYMDLLCYAMDLYLQAGDTVSADYCRERLLAVPGRLERVKETTEPIAWKLVHKPELELPERYLEILEELRGK